MRLRKPPPKRGVRLKGEPSPDPERPQQKAVVFTPVLGKTIVKVLRSGAHMVTAAHYVNLSVKTVYEWMARGGRGERPFDKFLVDVRRAMNGAELDHITKINRAKDWRAHAWMLSRRHPSRWDKHDLVEHARKSEAEREAGITPSTMRIYLPQEDED